MIGHTRFIGGEQYMEVNDHGTLEKLAAMPWYSQLWLYIRTRFVRMTPPEIRKYVRRKAR